MKARVVGVVEAVTPMKLVVAKARGEPPRIGARVTIRGARGRVVDVIGPVDSPYLVIRLDDPNGDDIVGAEVIVEERVSRRRKARGRGRHGRSGSRAVRRRGTGGRRRGKPRVRGSRQPRHRGGTGSRG